MQRMPVQGFRSLTPSFIVQSIIQSSIRLFVHTFMRSILYVSRVLPQGQQY